MPVELHIPQEALLVLWFVLISTLLCRNWLQEFVCSLTPFQVSKWHSLLGAGHFICRSFRWLQQCGDWHSGMVGIYFTVEDMILATFTIYDALQEHLCNKTIISQSLYSIIPYTASIKIWTELCLRLLWLVTCMGNMVVVVARFCCICCVL